MAYNPYEHALEGLRQGAAGSTRMKPGTRLDPGQSQDPVSQSYLLNEQLASELEHNLANDARFQTNSSGGNLGDLLGMRRKVAESPILKERAILDAEAAENRAAVNEGFGGTSEIATRSAVPGGPPTELMARGPVGTPAQRRGQNAISMANYKASIPLLQEQEKGLQARTLQSDKYAAVSRLMNPGAVASGSGSASNDASLRQQYIDAGQPVPAGVAGVSGNRGGSPEYLKTITSSGDLVLRETDPNSRYSQTKQKVIDEAMNLKRELETIQKLGEGVQWGGTGSWGYGSLAGMLKNSPANIGDNANASLRAKLSELLAQIGHDRYGSAFTGTEKDMLLDFAPNQNNAPETNRVNIQHLLDKVRDKLNQFGAGDAEAAPDYLDEFNNPNWGMGAGAN